MLIRVWQYDVAPGSETAFERAYGGAGSWAQLFRAGPGCLGTELFRSTEVPREELVASGRLSE